MYPHSLEGLLKSGEANFRSYITNGCFEWSNSEPIEKQIQSHDHHRVHQVLDYLFQKNIEPDELAQWIKCLFSGRLNLAKFLQEVKKYDKSSKCGLVWTTNFIAYRCRTCAISLCMSLCAECFLNGNHEGHDFNMFRSQAGGACDCGDDSVMKEEGFCKFHQSKTNISDSINVSIPPNSLLCIAKEIMPKLLYHLVLSMRENRTYDGNEMLKCLLDKVFVVLSDLGTAMQEILSNALTDAKLYRSFFSEDSEIVQTEVNEMNNKDDIAHRERLKILSENYKSVMKDISLETIFADQSSPIILNHEEITSKISSFSSNLVHEHFLDEIIFWTAIYEYPSNLITFLLKMLPNEEYKIFFSLSFLKHYFRISMLILYPTNRFSHNRDIFLNKLAHAVVHVSVQLFSNEKLVLYLCDATSLFEIIILTLKHAIEGNQKNFWGVMVPNLLFQNDNDHPPRVVSCRHHIMTYHRFWPVISDLNNLLTHELIALRFLQDDRLIDLWLEFIMAFQGMNCNIKADLVEDENIDYKASYLSELEISASFMWAIISHLKDYRTKELTVNFTKHILKWLKIWLDFAKPNLKKIDRNKCSFHLPLHRYFAVFLQHAISVQGARVDEMLPVDSRDLLKSIVYHPLQTLTVYQHIIADMWKYNGLQIRTQAINYINAHFCNSTIDPDLFLVQLSSIYLDPEDFVELCSSLHYFNNYLHIRLENLEFSNDKRALHLENAFTFFAYIAAQRINFGFSPEEITRKEMIALLSLDEKTHSQIQEALPYKCGFTQQISIIETLNEIADYKQPEVEASGDLVQGYFVLKNRIWELEYDPLFVLYRNSTRRDFQTSMQRFAIFANQNCKQQHSSTDLWPPFRIPSKPSSSFYCDSRNVILNSRTLQAYYFSILLNASNNINYISQHLLSIVIYLMELTMIESNKNVNDIDWSSLTLDFNIVSSFNENDFSNWFTSSDIVDNFLIKFQQFRMKDNNALSSKVVLDIFSSVFEDFLTTADHNELIEQIRNDHQDNTDFEIVSEDLSPAPTQESEYQQYLIDLNDEDSDFDDDAREFFSDDNISEMNTSSTGNNNRLYSRKKSYQYDRKYDISINESFLSILLKLYSKFTGKKDAFKTSLAFLEQFNFESRFGDGSFFIGCLLKRFIFSLAQRVELRNNPDSFEISKESIEIVLKFIENERRSIWPKKNDTNSIENKQNFEREKSHDSENMEFDPETIQKMEKKRMAQELRSKILNKFKNIQNEFEQHVEKENNAMDTDGGPSTSYCDIDSSGPSVGTSSSNTTAPESINYQPPTFECAICGDSGHSMLERSFVQITHLQSTSILGNAQSRTVAEELENSEITAFDKRTVTNSLPLSDDDVLEMNLKRHIYRDSFDRTVEMFSSTFSKSSWLSAFNIGWCGGIHVQSCGHYMHLDCFQSYVSHMRREPDSLFEFSCPLCRKIGNSVSPIIPNFANLYALVKSRSNRNSPQLINEIWSLLSNSDTSRLANTTFDESQFLKVFSTAMEDLMRATDAQYRSICVNPCPESLFLYLLSISRINIEYMIIMWREQLLKGNTTRSCFVNLFQALSLNAKLVLPMHFTMLWSQLTGILPENESKSEVLPFTKDVPILLKDCSALLLQFLYALPFNIDKAYFLTITQALLNLNFIQALLLVSYHMPPQQIQSVKSRILLKENSAWSRPIFSTFFDYIAFMMNSIDPNSFTNYNMFRESSELLSEKSMLDMIVKLCLPFMRMSSMLLHMLYDEALPEYRLINPQTDPLEEFANLAQFLTLNKQDSLEVEEFTHDESFFRPFLNWVINDPSELIKRWYEEYENSIKFDFHATKAILKDNFVIVARPRLLNLPRVYEKLFMFYHKRPCEFCKRVSKDPSICLVCGKMVCIRDCCCRVDKVLEGVRHSRVCGARTAIYLAVNSSLIYVIRGPKACIWGSVYLDEFGEEDRDLKRGKPLYLSIERYRLLEKQWLSHILPFVNKKWVAHKDLI